MSMNMSPQVVLAKTHSNPALVLLRVLDDGHGVVVFPGRLFQPGVQGLLVPVQLTLELLHLLCGFEDVVLEQRGKRFRLKVLPVVRYVIIERAF